MGCCDSKTKEKKGFEEVQNGDAVGSHQPVPVRQTGDPLGGHLNTPSTPTPALAKESPDASDRESGSSSAAVVAGRGGDGSSGVAAAAVALPSLSLEDGSSLVDGKADDIAKSVDVVDDSSSRFSGSEDSSSEGETPRSVPAVVGEREGGSLGEPDAADATPSVVNPRGSGDSTGPTGDAPQEAPLPPSPPGHLTGSFLLAGAAAASAADTTCLGGPPPFEWVTRPSRSYWERTKHIEEARCNSGAGAPLFLAPVDEWQGQQSPAAALPHVQQDQPHHHAGAAHHPGVLSEGSAVAGEGVHRRYADPLAPRPRLSPPLLSVPLLGDASLHPKTLFHVPTHLQQQGPTGVSEEYSDSDGDTYSYSSQYYSSSYDTYSTSSGASSYLSSSPSSLAPYRGGDNSWHDSRGRDEADPAAASLHRFRRRTAATAANANGPSGSACNSYGAYPQGTAMQRSTPVTYLFQTLMERPLGQRSVFQLDSV